MCDHNRYVGPYHIGCTFGRGSFGSVKVARHNDTGAVVALKRIKVEDAVTKKLVELEIKLQRAVESPYAAKLYEVWRTQSCLVKQDLTQC